jgi:hypothetical protein
MARAVGDMNYLEMLHGNFRRGCLLAVPVLVPISMAGLFRLLSRYLAPRRAYNLGFAIYWLGWCCGFPLVVLGPRSVARLLTVGRRPSLGEAGLLFLPIAGAVGTQLLPNRKAIDKAVAAVMVGSAAVNAVGEELLWRGIFIHEFPDDVVRGALWPLAGFSIWHLAPQMVFPSGMGRWQFVLGAGFVGLCSVGSAWRNKGLRNCVLSHIATDACGVTVARFRLGMSD